MYFTSKDSTGNDKGGGAIMIVHKISYFVGDPSNCPTAGDDCRPCPHFKNCKKAISDQLNLKKIDMCRCSEEVEKNSRGSASYMDTSEILGLGTDAR